MMPEDSTTSPSAVVDLAGLVEVQAERIKKLEADLATAQEALRLDRHRCSSMMLDVESVQESISNRLSKQIDQLRRERGELCHQVEAEEEFIMNSLQRKLDRIQKEKVELEIALEHEQEQLINKLRSNSISDDHPSSPTTLVQPAIKSATPNHLSKSSASVLDTRDTEYQSTISQLQTENFRLLTENIRLAQLLRRHGVSVGSPNATSTTSTTASVGIPLRRCDSNFSDHSRSGSISELRKFDNYYASDDDHEDQLQHQTELAAMAVNISPIRPKKS